MGQSSDPGKVSSLWELWGSGAVPEGSLRGPKNKRQAAGDLTPASISRLCQCRTGDSLDIVPSGHRKTIPRKLQLGQGKANTTSEEHRHVVTPGRPEAHTHLSFHWTSLPAHICW